MALHTPFQSPRGIAGIYPSRHALLPKSHRTWPSDQRRILPQAKQIDAIPNRLRAWFGRSYVSGFCRPTGPEFVDAPAKIAPYHRPAPAATEVDGVGPGVDALVPFSVL